MIDNSLTTEGTTPPGDVRELILARKRKEVFENIRGISYLFFGLQAYFLILFFWGEVLPIPVHLGFVIGVGAYAAGFVSIFVALIVVVITLRHAMDLCWWMIALGVSPWMVVATETCVVVLVIVWT